MARVRVTSLAVAAAATCLLVVDVLAQPVFRGVDIFPPEEFAARRAKVMAQIGDGVAIVLGTTEPPGEMPFRQNTQFFYLTGVTEPRASVIIDGRAKTTTVFLPPKTPQQDNSQYGPGMGPGVATANALGVDAAVDRAGFTDAITATSDGLLEVASATSNTSAKVRATSGAISATVIVWPGPRPSLDGGRARAARVLPWFQYQQPCALESRRRSSSLKRTSTRPP
mgnify:CR=1 FL=1